MMMAVLGLAMAAAFSSCGTPSLDTYAKRIQRKLPTEIQNGWTIVACENKADCFEFVVEFDEKSPDFVAIDLEDETNQALFQIIMEASMKEVFLENKEMLEPLRLCKKEQKDFRFVLKAKHSGKTFLCEIPMDELPD